MARYQPPAGVSGVIVGERDRRMDQFVGFAVAPKTVNSATPGVIPAGAETITNLAAEAVVGGTRGSRSGDLAWIPKPPAGERAQNVRGFRSRIEQSRAPCRGFTRERAALFINDS